MNVGTLHPTYSPMCQESECTTHGKAGASIKDPGPHELFPLAPLAP